MNVPHFVVIFLLYLHYVKQVPSFILTPYLLFQAVFLLTFVIIILQAMPQAFITIKALLF